MMDIINFILGLAVGLLLLAMYIIYSLKKQVNELRSTASMKETTIDVQDTEISTSPKQESSDSKGDEYVKDLYDKSIVLPFWKNTVYDLKPDWVNKHATTNLTGVRFLNIKKDQTLVVFCDIVDINGDYFRLHISDPFEDMWTAKRKLNDKLRDAFTENINQFVNKIVILSGYQENNNFYITNIEPTRYEKFIA